jgi:hypothetical protein
MNCNWKSMFIVTLTLGIVSFFPSKWTQTIGMIVFMIYFWNWKVIWEVICFKRDPVNGERRHRH